jgi:hypothetical protein
MILRGQLLEAYTIKKRGILINQEEKNGVLWQIFAFPFARVKHNCP